MTDLNTSHEPERLDVTEPMPAPEDPQDEAPAASPAERLKSFFNGPDRVRNRAVVGAAAVCVAVACGLGIYSCANRPATLPAEGGDPVASEAASTLADEVESLIPDLTFQGASVAPDAAACEVEAKDGHVMVTETSSAPAENMVDGAARRAAALAGQAKSSSYDVADVTWVATDPEGKVEVAVTVSPADAAADMAQQAPSSDKAPTTSDILHGSTGWDMTDDAHAGLPEGSDIDKSGGAAPTTPAGSTIVPGEKLPDEPKADEQAPSAGGDPGSSDQPSSGDGDKSDSSKPSDKGDAKQDSSSTGNSGQSAGGNASSGSSSSASGSSSSSGSNSGSSSSAGSTSSQPAQKRWVVDRAAYDEPIYETQPVYGQKWVQDSAAYDEKVCIGEAYQFSDGYVTSSDSDAWQHQKQTGASYSVVPQYQTVHHDATGHYETVQTGTKQVQTGTRHHDEVGHWE